MDSTTFLLIGGICIAGALAMAWLMRQAVSPPKPPYEPQEALFTRAEANFLLVLDQALGDHYRAFGKVRLADIVRTRKGLEPKERQAAFNKICAKHVDFVICRDDTLETVCVVELDDSTHGREDRVVRDIFLDDVCDCCDIPLVRFKARASYNVDDVRDTIAEAIFRNG